ncbi:MAG TPA: 5-oxoprolinase [Alphaproteobacteria bacterium]|nr:5-oxoprolinase [Alphaproteobacteria bacterium]
MLDAVILQIMWNRLISVVEEQAQALIRTAFSTSVREAGDLSAGVYDDKGNMLAQAVTGTPGHVNAMAESVGHFMREIGVETMAEGDVYITNDPWMGTGHLHDITVVTPVFRHQKLIGFFASTAHVVDVGGRGFGADGNSIYEEGIQIPIMRFINKGIVNHDLVKLICQNVREADQVVGDIYALATSNDVGANRLMAMLDEYDAPDLNMVADFILARSHAATLERIASLTPGSAHASMNIDGFDEVITIAITVSIEDDRICADFTGTSGIDKKGINVPLVYTRAYTCYGLKVAIAPDIPNNTASLAAFVISAPSGTIVNAERPAPVALRHIVGQMLPDVAFGALHQLLPDGMQAEGASALCNFQVSLTPVEGANISANHPGDAKSAEVLSFNSGGTGARASLDGLNATAFPSGVMTMPVEATENVGPLIIRRKELRPDSGGAGQYRGGLGQFMDVAARDGYDMTFSAMLDRADHPARGREGGKSGGATQLHTSDGQVLRGKGRQAIATGQTVHLAFAGGGGYGDPLQRDINLIKRDLRRGYISPEAAMQDYGITAAQMKAWNEAADD